MQNLKKICIHSNNHNQQFEGAKMWSHQQQDTVTVNGETLCHTSTNTGYNLRTIRGHLMMTQPIVLIEKHGH